jgi:RHS repeat-associated protein
LLAEYAANANVASPKDEYGYHNGQLLVTATITSGWGTPPTLHDNPLVASETMVQARHITELQDGIDALRSHLNMSPYLWQYSVAINDWITINPIIEMRTVLDLTLGAPSGGYSAGLAQDEPIMAIHIQELRNRVLDAWNNGASTQIHWLLSDQLGTPRMIFDQSGSLTVTNQNGNYVSGMTRHDYLPFGEELSSVIGLRSSAQGYTNSDGARQKFTSYERDNETSLDFAQARYYANSQGRFTRPDPWMASADEFEPQSWNRYAYVANNPLAFTDPSGMSQNQAEDLVKLKLQQNPQQPGYPNEPPPPPMVLKLDIVRIAIVADRNTGRNLSEFEKALVRLGDFAAQVDGLNVDPASDRLVSGALNVTGAAASLNRYRTLNPAETSWRGFNGGSNRIGWGGNGSTGGRSLAVTKAGAFKVLGRAAGGLGMALSLGQGYQAYQRGDRGGVVKSGFDLGFGAAGTFGGPYGAAASGVYFGVDMTVGWPKMAETALERKVITGFPKPVLLF